MEEVEEVGNGGNAAGPRWLATASTVGLTLTIKLVNYGPSPRPVTVRWAGSTPIQKVISAKLLTATSPDAQNTLDAPEAVAPAALAPAPTVGAGGKGLVVEMPAWSLVVVEAQLAPQR